MDTSPTDAIQLADAYHQRTKHHLQRYARSLGALDWETQPDPFRTYAGAPRIELPLAADAVEARYDELFTPGAVRPRPLDLESLAAFLELALGLTAWKESSGSRWALRSNPSSGNLHPTEGYALVPELAGCPAGLFHYLSRDHALELRCLLQGGSDQALARALPPGGFLVGLSSIHWREAWKYGERAFRYCQLDVGHAIGSVRYAAAALGWRIRLLHAPGDDDVARLLGLAREEDLAGLDAHDHEHPDVLLLVAPEIAAEQVPDITELVTLVSAGQWSGKPNQLSSAYHDWPVIDEVAEATRKPRTPDVQPPPFAEASPLEVTCKAPAATIIRRRRSAVAFDGKTTIPCASLFEMLDELVPRKDAPPWDALPWEPRIHLVLFVHRVEGLERGLYWMERSAGGDLHARIRSMVGSEAEWVRAAGSPEHLRLYRLASGDLRRAAATISCHQEIAADGAFSLGMVADFRAALDAGAFWYRRLFWECGLVGQALYLAAEAAAVRATGIGCYFDDACHRLLGLEGDAFQSLYHLTIGGPVEDTRLVTHPPYAHLAGRPVARGRSPAQE